MTKPCPACGADVPQGETTCPGCHIIMAKYKRASANDGMADSARDLQNALSHVTGIAVDQELMTRDSLLDPNAHNRYLVRSDEGALLYDAVETSSLVSNAFLRSFRPFLLTLSQSGSGVTVFTLQKPFAIYNDRAELKDGAGRLVGAIESGFPFPLRNFVVRDHRGVALYRVSGAFWRPRTFKVFRGDVEVGVISKNMSGALLPGFGNPDRFKLAFPQGAPIAHKALLMAALFMIDLFHFDEDPRYRKKAWSE